MGFAQRWISSPSRLNARTVGLPLTPMIFASGLASSGASICAPHHAHWYLPSTSRMVSPNQKALLSRPYTSPDRVIRGRPVLHAALDDICETKPSQLEIDVTGLTFCDSSGLHEFGRAAEFCAANKASMSVIGAQNIVRRVFEVSGLGHLLAPT